MRPERYIPIHFDVGDGCNDLRGHSGVVDFRALGGRFLGWYHQSAFDYGEETGGGQFLRCAVPVPHHDPWNAQLLHKYCDLCQQTGVDATPWAFA